MITCQVFPSGPYQTNAYVAFCAKSQEAAIIDPAPNSAEKIEAFISQHHLEPKKIVLTHSHWDHIADVSVLQNRYHIPVHVHIKDALNLEQPGADGLPCWIKIPGVKPDFYLEEGSHVRVGELNFLVLHTPGHSPGSVCLFEPNEGILFSGDTLFQGAIGNLSFPTSQPDLMQSSLVKLAKLPLNTLVFPGHGPSTTIQDELETLLSLDY